MNPISYQLFVAGLVISLVLCDLSWVELIVRDAFYLEKMSYFCDSNFRSTSYYAVEFPESIPLVFEIKKDSLPDDYFRALRIFSATDVELVFLWGGNLLDHEAISLHNEIRTLEIASGNMLNLGKNPDNDASESKLYLTIANEIRMLLNILKSVCQINDLSQVTINSLLALSNKYNSDKNRTSHSVVRYVENTVIPLLQRNNNICNPLSEELPPILLFHKETPILSSSGLASRVSVRQYQYFPEMSFAELSQSAYIVSREIYLTPSELDMYASAIPLSRLLLQCSPNATTSTIHYNHNNNTHNPIEIFHDICHPLRTRLLCSYHTIISTTVLAMSKVVTKLLPKSLLTRDPDLIEDWQDTSTPPPPLLPPPLTSFSKHCSHRAHILSLGLGGGELHGFLMEHFPCMSIDSVEVDPVIIQASQDYFGIELCDVIRPMDISDNYLSTEDEEEQSCKYKGSINGDSNSNASDFSMVCYSESRLQRYIESLSTVTVDSSECRSRVFQFEAWTFVRAAAAAAAAVGNPNRKQSIKLQWDVVIIDLYDTHGSMWDGREGTGTSNPTLPANVALLDIITATRDITEPDAGLSVFHIHRDSVFPQYLEVIQQVFADVIFIRVGENDSLIVASRYLGLKVLGSFSGRDSSSTSSTSRVVVASNHDNSNKKQSEDDEGMETSTGIDVCKDRDQVAEAVTNFSLSFGYSKRAAMSLRYAFYESSKKPLYLL